MSLFILAMDHRESLGRTVYGIKGEPSAEQIRQLSAGKELVYQGLVEALKRGAVPALPPREVGVLVDERYGASVARAAKAAGLTLAMPIERSGQPWFGFEFGDGKDGLWMEHVQEFDPHFVKVLVRDNPKFAERDRKTQAETLAMVSRTLRQAKRPLILELLVPATPEQKSAQGDRYDQALRPELTVQVIRDLHAAGVEPEIWKIEGLEDSTAAKQMVAVAQEGGRSAVRCIVLGRDAPQEHLDRWLRIAAPVKGFEGFAIGRSIWEQPLMDQVAGKITAPQMATQVADHYLHFLKSYQAASAV